MNEITPSEAVKEITIIARWMNGVFVPERPLNLPENTTYKLTIIRLLSAEVDAVRETPK